MMSTSQDSLTIFETFSLIQPILVLYIYWLTYKQTVLSNSFAAVNCSYILKNGLFLLSMAASHAQRKDLYVKQVSKWPMRTFSA